MASEGDATRMSKVGFVPIVSAYASTIGLVDEIDRLLDCEMEVSPGPVVLARILDAWSGKSFLFRPSVPEHPRTCP